MKCIPAFEPLVSFCFTVRLGCHCEAQWWWFGRSVVSNSCDPMDCSSCIHALDDQPLIWGLLSRKDALLMSQTKHGGPDHELPKP